MSAAWVSPLAEVERAVQDRAKGVSIDMSSPGAAAQLRALIREEVERWSHDHKRGLRPFDLADPDALAQRAERNLIGYGPLGPSSRTTTSLGRAEGQLPFGATHSLCLRRVGRVPRRGGTQWAGAMDPPRSPVDNPSAGTKDQG